MDSRLIRHDKVTDELGNTVEIKLWKISPTVDKPKGYKYSLVYIVGGKVTVHRFKVQGSRFKVQPACRRQGLRSFR